MRRLAAVLILALCSLAAPAAAQAGTCEYGGGYPGDDAPKTALAAWMADGATDASLPGELPVMGALVESEMRNIEHGDGDSFGYFGMRQSIWNTGDYEGYPENPELQLKWFVDQARKVRQQRVAGGEPDYGEDPAGWGEWVADVLNPAEQYRYKYQLRLDDARALMQEGCESGQVGDAVPPPFRLKARRAQDALRRRALLVRVRCTVEDCRAWAHAAISLPGAARTYRLRTPARAIEAGSSVVLRLKLKKRVRRAVSRALRRGRRVKAKVRVTVRDSAGNRTVARRTIRIKKPAPR